MASNDKLEYLHVFLKGMAMGAADAVPGVSGGTIALLTGIYGRFISAITSINPGFVKEVVKALTVLDKELLVEKLNRADIKFLTALGLGVVTALLTLIQFMHYLLTIFPIQTYGLFFGLIAASVIALYRQVKLDSINTYLVALTGFALSFMVSGYASSTLGHSFPVIFVSGMVAVSAMVLPGISGSLFLIILGQYEYMIGVVSKFIDSIFSGTVSLNSLNPVVVFSSGALVGGLTVSHAVRYALDRQRQLTLVFLISLVAGALRAPVVETSRVLVMQGIEWVNVIPEFGLPAGTGFMLVLLLDYKAGVIDI